MKKMVIVLILVAAALYFFFIHGGPLKKDFTLNGETFKYAKHMYGGAIDNHFYTPDGVDFNVATSFVQILEFDDKIPESDWPARLKPLLNRYQLKPLVQDGLDMTGKGKMSGYYFKSYATPIALDGKDLMAIFITGSSEAMDDDSDDDVYDMIDQIKNIRFD